MLHVPGAKHRAADAISRHPTGQPDTMRLEDDIAEIALDETIPFSIILPSLVHTDNTVHNVSDEPTTEAALYTPIIASISSMRCITWDEVRTATSSDEDMVQLVQMIEQGIPESRNALPPPLRPYHPFRDQLSTLDGVIIYRDRIVIPPVLRPEILASLHSAHQVVTSMTSRAEGSIFWPGITSNIINLRNNCNQCNRMAPSQPNAPPVPLVYPTFPFQCVCADYFHHKVCNYLVIVDRYSNWPIVERAAHGSHGLIECLRHTFGTFGIPNELSSDGGPEFTATSTREFLKTWGVHHRLSSVAFPHSNCRAEVGVKTVKRLITDKTGPQGELDTDAIQRAILQYRNTPDRDSKLSPAMHIFGHPIKDFIPIVPGNYHPHETWRDTLSLRESALRNRHMKIAERLSEHTRRLPPLIVGDHVRIQNQTGLHPLKWDKTGRVIEVHQFDQYLIRVDGSGRATLRNRKFLRRYTPVYSPPIQHTIDGDLVLQSPPPQSKAVTPPHDNTTKSQPQTLIAPSITGTRTRGPPDSSPPSDSLNVNLNPAIPMTSPVVNSAPPDTPTHQTPEQPAHRDVNPPEQEGIPPPTPRRSTRQRHKPAWLSDYVNSSGAE